MTQVTVWAGGLCIAAIACTAMRILAPEGSMGRLFKTITVAFFICCLVAPFFSAKDKFDISLPENAEINMPENLEKQTEKQLKKQLDTSILQICNESLTQHDVKIIKVDTKMDNREDTGIYISNVNVYIDKKDEPKTITINQVLEQKLGVRVVVRAVKT